MFSRLAKLLDNPYQYGATVLAKGLVSLATIMWSVIVLLKEDALRPFNYYATMTTFMPEDWWAALLLLISVVLLFRLYQCYPPRKLGAIGYAFIGGFWAHVWWGIVMQPGPVWPASFSAVSIVVILALFAFIANPKHD